MLRLRRQRGFYAICIRKSTSKARKACATAHNLCRLDQEAMKQQALIYNQTFLIQQLERKIRRAQGERSDEEKDALQQKVDALTTQLEDWKRKNAILNVQHKRATEDLRLSKRQLDILIKQRDASVDSVADLNIYNERAATQLVSKTREKEELMVDENILRLELRKLRGFLNTRADDVLSLENRQAQLQLALEERTKEIEIHRDMLRAHIKAAEEERHSATSEWRDRLNRVDKLKRKYEIIVSRMGGGEDGDEPQSQAYYLIKASQVK
jgi:hypothetical protein